jgi:hypothetical protein
MLTFLTSFLGPLVVFAALWEPVEKLTTDDNIAGTFSIQESFQDQIEERFRVVASVCNFRVADVEVGKQVAHFGVRCIQAEGQLDDLRAGSEAVVATALDLANHHVCSNGVNQLVGEGIEIDEALEPRVGIAFPVRLI